MKKEIIYRKDGRSICLDCIYRKDVANASHCDKGRGMVPQPVGCSLYRREERKA